MGETMVERVARALVRARGAMSANDDAAWAGIVADYRRMEAEWGDRYTDGRSLVTDAFRDARAAIEAMREPKPREVVMAEPTTAELIAWCDAVASDHERFTSQNARPGPDDARGRKWWDRDQHMARMLRAIAARLRADGGRDG